MQSKEKKSKQTLQTQDRQRRVYRNDLRERPYNPILALNRALAAQTLARRILQTALR